MVDYLLFYYLCFVPMGQVFTTKEQLKLFLDAERVCNHPFRDEIWIEFRILAESEVLSGTGQERPQNVEQDANPVYGFTYIPRP